MIWIILRGIENLSTDFYGFQLPSNARLRLHKIENQIYQPLSWVPLVDILNGHGLLFSHVLAIMSGNLNFPEGCYHACTKYEQEFPGLIVSTGIEDYFNSAFYFNAEHYHSEVSDCTHYRELSNNTL